MADVKPEQNPEIVQLSDGTNIIVPKAGGTFGQMALPVWPNAVQRDTYVAAIDAVVLAGVAGGGAVKLWSLFHSNTSTKTVRIRRIIMSGVVTTASAAAAGHLRLFLNYGINTASAGNTVTPAKPNSASGNAEASFWTSPTITTAAGNLLTQITMATGTGGATVGTTISPNGNPFIFYDWQENGETVPLTLRAGVNEAWTFLFNATWATTAPSITWGGYVIYTEE